MSSKLINADGYKPDTDASFVARIATFLNHTATEFPNQYASPNLITKAIFGIKKLPKDGSQEVLFVQRTMSRVGPYLQTNFNRTLVPLRSVGFRATINSDDVVKSALPKKVRRLDGARTSLSRTAALVDVKQLSNTPETKPWTVWFKNEVSDLVEEINTPEFGKKMLPPSSEGKDK